MLYGLMILYLKLGFINFKSDGDLLYFRYSYTYEQENKGTQSSSFIFLFISDSGGWSKVCGVVQTLKALWRFRNYALTRHSQRMIICETALLLALSSTFLEQFISQQ